jgi:beta-galactosidase
MYQGKGISGCFGWCMFDYNTHREFGSGDRMCYHGVMDQYRNPKLAAAVYASQQEAQPVCVISSSMDIGEHPGGKLATVYAFTNGDEVRLYKNDQFVRTFYPDTHRFPGMPHPPVVIDDYIGELLETQEGLSHKASEDVKVLLQGISEYGLNNLPPKFLLKMAKLLTLHHLTVEDGYRFFNQYASGWGSGSSGYRFEAWKDGKVMATVSKAPVEQLHLHLAPSGVHLVEGDTYDMALVRISVLDQNENPLPYYQEAVTLTVAGAIELVGPNAISLPGGSSGCYVRTLGQAGEGSLTVSAPHCSPVTLRFTVTKGGTAQ